MLLLTFEALVNFIISLELLRIWWSIFDIVSKHSWKFRVAVLSSLKDLLVPQRQKILNFFSRLLFKISCESFINFWAMFLKICQFNKKITKTSNVNNNMQTHSNSIKIRESSSRVELFMFLIFILKIRHRDF